MENTLAKLRDIVQHSATAASSAKQMSYIVSAIRGAMSVDVSSLYLVGEHGELILSATEGLDVKSIGKVKLQIGEGLVGSIALSRHPINIEEASSHASYRYFPETHEENYNGFLGVPLVYLRRLVGVLVVQRREKIKFSDEEESFLITIAAQLAVTVDPENVTFAEVSTTKVSRKVSGVKGAAGIGIGYPHIVADNGLDQVVDREINDAAAELTAFNAALKKTRAELDQASNAMAGNIPQDVAAIFSVYRMLLDSGNLLEDIKAKIDEGNWAPGAIRETISEYAALFSEMEDPYLKARAEDIRNLGNKLYSHLRGDEQQTINQNQDVILVGDLVSVTDIAQYPKDQLKGILCTSGSPLSHTAVLANALGIPAVMGTGKIKDISQRTLMIVDGHQGHVILNPTKTVIKAFKAQIAREHSLIAGLGELKDKPAITPDQYRIKLYTNTGLVADISPGLARGAEGIGLYRSEIPFMIRENFPTEEEQLVVYRHVLESYRGKPVYMRTLDIGGDKPLSYYSFTEDNPYLGWRGIRFTLDNVPIFMTQIRAMLRASEGFDNLHILLPMVSRIDEVDSFQEILTDACGQLAEEGHHIKRPAVGIMVEVPAAVTLLPFLAKRIDFISIGSNDLSQYLLAVDRNNPRVSRMFDNLQPVVIHEINKIISEAKSLNLQVGLCGEMASDPLSVVLLLGMGIETLSMSAFNLPKIKWLIRSITRGAAEGVLKQALLLEHEDKIRSLIVEMLNNHDLAELIELS